MTETLPYTLQKYDNGQDYFETDHGRIYTYSLENVTASVIEHASPILAGYDMTFHCFGFTPDSREALEYDSRIVPTINGIATAFFQDNAKVMLYVCDSMDGRGAVRQRLFTQWVASNNAYYHDRVNIAIEDDMIYCGIVTRSNLDRRKLLDTEFVDKAANVFTQKF